MIQALSRQGGGSQATPGTVRSLLGSRGGSGTESADDGDQNLQGRKEAFLAKARAGQMEDYLKSTRTAPLSRYEIKAGWEIPAIL